MVIIVLGNRLNRAVVGGIIPIRSSTLKNGGPISCQFEPIGGPHPSKSHSRTESPVTYCK